MAMLVAERIERPPGLFGPGPEVAPRRSPAADSAVRERDGLGGGLTLDEAIVGVWEGLAARVVVACPLCSGALRPHSAHDAVGGRCGDCGTTLD
jgi:hypothetical protein